MRPSKTMLADVRFNPAAPLRVTLSVRVVEVEPALWTRLSATRVLLTSVVAAELMEIAASGVVPPTA